MTYILGARCKDGVVLIGDTKVTIGGGTDVEYSKKITMPLINVVMGSAGSGGLYKVFQNRMITKVNIIAKEKGHNHPLLNTEAGFFVLVTKVIREMHNDYGKDSHTIQQYLQILCVTRIQPKAKLTLFTGFGIQEPVKDITAIGHGSYHASLFHKYAWRKGMSMEETAKMGLFIIHYLRDMQLDISVGYNDEFLPQVVYIPHVIFPKDIPEKPPSNISNIERKELEKKVNQLRNKYPIQQLPKEKIQQFLEEIKPKVEDIKQFTQKLF